MGEAALLIEHLPADMARQVRYGVVFADFHDRQLFVKIYGVCTTYPHAHSYTNTHKHKYSHTHTQHVVILVLRDNSAVAANHTYAHMHATYTHSTGDSIKNG